MFCESLENGVENSIFMENPIKASLQLSVTVSKGRILKDIFPFATVMEGCKEANFIGFFPFNLLKCVDF